VTDADLEAMGHAAEEYALSACPPEPFYTTAEEVAPTSPRGKAAEVRKRLRAMGFSPVVVQLLSGLIFELAKNWSIDQVLAYVLRLLNR
jgi:hypothetical protein